MVITKINEINMSSFIEIVTKKSSFRAVCKDLSISHMEAMAKNLAEFIEKRTQQEAKFHAAKAAQSAKKKEILKAMTAAGLSLDDFFSKDEESSQKHRKPVVAQYRIVDANGQSHEWSGRGRTPKVFAEYFANDGSKDSCRI